MKLIKYYYDEVHDCWVAHYRDSDGLLVIKYSISKPKESAGPAIRPGTWEETAYENLY
jgi:hypothetical protein